MKTSKFLALAAVMTGFMVAHLPHSLAQGQKTGRIVIGVPPGASFDTTARVLADRMSKEGSLPYLVENRPGAGQTIAAGLVARAPADGDGRALPDVARPCPA